MAAGTNLPVGGAVPTELWLGGSVLGVAGCPESEFKRDRGAAVKTLKYMTLTHKAFQWNSVCNC